MINTSSLGQLNQDVAPPPRATNRRPTTRRSRSGARRSGGLHLSKVDARAAAAVAMEQIEHPKRGGDDGDSNDLSRPGQEAMSKNDNGARPGIADDDRPASYRSVLDFQDAAGGASGDADGPFTATAADASPHCARRPLKSCLGPATNDDEDGDGDSKRPRKSRHVSFSQLRVREYESRKSFVGLGWRYNPRETVEAIPESHDAGGAAAAGGTMSPFESLKDLRDLDIEF